MKFDWRRFTSDKRAGVAVLVGLAFPVVALAVLGAIDLSSFFHGRSFLQSVADAAALRGATQLGFDQSPATSHRAEDFASSQAMSLGQPWTVATSATSDMVAGSMIVTIDASRNSVFGNLIRAVGYKVHITSTALMNSRRPLCVLSSASEMKNVLQAENQSTVTSPDCLIQSDSDIQVDNGAKIVAGDVRATTSAKGNIFPAALTNSPAVPDPFSTLSIVMPTLCNDSDKLQYSAGTQTLNPGAHCGDVHLDGTATLTLNPGEHYFIKGNFHLTGNSRVVGTDVTLIFHAKYSLKFDQSASMSLDGRQSGPFAGFVLVTDRQYTRDFEISTNQARKLLGTIYLPNASLTVDGTNNVVADQSPWTVIVAQQVRVKGSANLVLNANYGASSVPVPPGVGYSARSVRLSQ